MPPADEPCLWTLDLATEDHQPASAADVCPSEPALQRVEVGSASAAECESVIDAVRSHVLDGVLLVELERRTGPLLDALPAAIYTTDSDGHITFYNQAAADLWGHRPKLGSAEWCGSWRIYRLDGKPLPHDQCPMAIALKENRSIRGAEAIAERPDGTRVRFLAFPTPLHDAAGELIGAVNMLVDISDRKSSAASAGGALSSESAAASGA